jgi:uncharacterized membrane protein YeaQ/YmgE (transglycosylase-associated protein family)
MHILWIILIGFVAGVIAKLVTPGDNEPQGFILTTILGIVGTFVATYLVQAIGWYGPDQSAGLIGAVVGAVAYTVGLGICRTGKRSFINMRSPSSLASAAVFTLVACSWLGEANAASRLGYLGCQSERDGSYWRQHGYRRPNCTFP